MSAQLGAARYAIAARLQALDMIGERALLLYPPGLDYIATDFGWCLYTGIPPFRQPPPGSA